MVLFETACGELAYPDLCRRVESVEGFSINKILPLPEGEIERGCFSNTTNTSPNPSSERRGDRSNLSPSFRPPRAVWRALMLHGNYDNKVI